MITRAIYIGCERSDLIINNWYRVKPHWDNNDYYYIYADYPHSTGVYRFIGELPKNLFLSLAEFRDRQIELILK